MDPINTAIALGWLITLMVAAIWIGCLRIDLRAANRKLERETEDRRDSNRRCDDLNRDNYRLRQMYSAMATTYGLQECNDD